MNKKGTVEVEMKTKGFEEVAEDIEMIADAMDAFPSTINVKARDCEINIHNTNFVETKETLKTYAPGGVIRPKPDYEPETEMIDRLISKLPPSKRTVSIEQELAVLGRIKNECKCRNECKGCWYDESEDPDIRACALSGIPEKWKL